MEFQKKLWRYVDRKKVSFQLGSKDVQWLEKETKSEVHFQTNGTSWENVEESYQPKLFFKVYFQKRINLWLKMNFQLPKLNLFCLQGITSIGLGPTDPTVILQKQEVLEVSLWKTWINRNLQVSYELINKDLFQIFVELDGVDWKYNFEASIFTQKCNR